MLGVQLALKQSQVFKKVMLRHFIIEHREEGSGEKDTRRHLNGRILQGLGQKTGFLTNCDLFLCISAQSEGLAHMDRKLAEPLWIVQLSGQSLGLAQACKDALEFSERNKRSLQVEPKVNYLLRCLPGFGQRINGAQSPFEETGGLVVRPSGLCEPAGIDPMGDCLAEPWDLSTRQRILTALGVEADRRWSSEQSDTNDGDMCGYPTTGPASVGIIPPGNIASDCF